MHEHPQIELYINVGSDQQNTLVEEQFDTIDLDAVVMKTLHAVGVQQQVMLTLLVTDDAGIQEMNKQYRTQNKPTDVLSFPLLEQPIVNAPADHLWETQTSEANTGKQTPTFVTPPDMIMNLGDIVMSWPTLVHQAAEANHSPLYELQYLLAHGVLHLVGYDDHSEAGYEAMVGIQQSVLQALGQKA